MMYELFYELIGYSWEGSSAAFPEAIFYVSGATFLIVLVCLIDLIYRSFRHFWR